MNTIQDFAKLLQEERIAELHRQEVGCQANIDNCKVVIVDGRRYAKVNIGRSGAFMVDKSTLEIFGIRGYGTINRKKAYGSLETIDQFYWGSYTPYIDHQKNNNCGGYSCDEEDNG